MKLDKICLFILACLIPAACADLNYTEETTRDEDWNFEYFGEGIKNMVFDVYAQVYSNEFESNSAYFLAGATDEAQYALESGAVNNYVNGGWTPANPYSDIWTKSYRAIAEACMFLEKLDKADISEWEHNAQYENWIRQMEMFPYELRFLRAYFYFELFRAYGDVPLVTTTLTNAQANSISRTPADQIVQFIVDEVDEIAPHLPVSYNMEAGTEIGRATRVAAYALKARTLLYAASPLFNPTNDKTKWAKAAEACKYIIDNAQAWGLKLSSYGSLWGHDAFFNQELIFGIGRNATNSFEMAHYPIGVENGSSGNCPTQSLVDQYEYQADGVTFGERNQGSIDLNTTNPYEGLDPRFALTVVKNGDEWPTNGSQKKVIETFAGGFNASPKYGATPTGYYLRKYVDGSCVTTADNQTTSRHTWIVFRLGEFYLNYAEAVFNATGSANDAAYGMTANEAINVLRNRADIQMPEFTEDGADWVKRYERERLVELAFENHRFWDVRRWKKGKEYFGNVQAADISADKILVRTPLNRQWDDKYYFYPIPQSEVKKNPNLGQNPGWN
ncbi:MAG: RagB/SusD family nutrient uptake outer membrane protein [Bacteroidales bacterium]|nr:RagB/SusD family nutrient uptake outer membrane protein [Bacteroidales bacterium]MBO5472134.1 RagB/SusD family nutrient uptake outer membrane protein [Bacteroidales bacterium]